MKCPNCQETMDCEQVPQVVSTTLSELARTGRDVKTIPAAHYYCGGCDSEWVWTRNEKILCVDAADANVLLRYEAHA